MTQFEMGIIKNKIHLHSFIHSVSTEPLLCGNILGGAGEQNKQGVHSSWTSESRKGDTQ